MEESRPHLRPYHPDIAIFLVAIPLISAFNYYLTYSTIRLNWFLALTYSIDTVQGYLAWWAVRSIIIYFDKTIPYEKGSLRRIIIQVVTTTFAGLLIIGATTEAVSWAIKGRGAIASFYTVDLFIISIWFYAINGFYVGKHYYNSMKGEVARREAELRVLTQGLLVKSGKQELRLDFNELNGFTLDGEYVAAVRRDGRKYYLDQSLDQLEKTLPAQMFFRLNRQYIISRKQMHGLKRADHGKAIALIEGDGTFPTEIPVSRLRVPALRSWFHPR